MHGNPIALFLLDAAVGHWRIAFLMPTILDTFIYIETLVLYCWSHHQNVTSNPEARCANALLRGSVEIVCFFSIVCLFYMSSRNEKILIYRNDKIFTISVIYKREWASTLSNSSSHVQPWGIRIAYSNFSICTTIFWMLMVQFARQQYFEWWWCSSNVYLLLGFCQFRRACFQHDNSRVAKLRKFILDQQMNININIFLPASTVQCTMCSS